MSDAKKCDRCGNFYLKNKSEHKGISIISNVMIRDSKYYDLCDECVKKLIIFMEYNADKE